MKRHILAACLITLLIPLFADTLYYRSDWVGLAMEPINRVRMDEFEYVLGVIAADEQTVKILYHKQKEWKRWEIISNARHEKTDEYEYEDKRLTAHSTFDRKGRIKTELRYRLGALVDKLVYTYSSRGIDYIQTFDEHDALAYTDEYELAVSGRLRRMRRVFPDGSEAVIHFTYGESVMVGQWEYRDGRVIDTQNNHNGQPQRREEWDKDQLVSVTEYTYDTGTGKLVKETEKQPTDNTQRERFYDAEGNLARETEGKANAAPVEFSYVYDGGKRVSTRKKSEIGVEEWKFYYDAAGDLQREEYFRRGFLQMRTVYTDSDSWYEEIFHEDEVIIRVYFVKEKKVREEFLQAGQVVRTREY